MPRHHVISKKKGTEMAMKENVLHLKSPGNWINDPNGFIYYNGEYHLFFQYFPYAPRWGLMHWGHAVSRDLVNWKHLGVALFPAKAYERNGIFSGSALELDGKLCLYYSAVRYLEEEEEDIHHAKEGMVETSQAMIDSADGIHFDNWKDKRQIIPVIRDLEKGDAKDTRDPKVWKENGEYFMILGSTYHRTCGQVLFYRSRDGRNWEYDSRYSSPEFGWMLECPDLFPLGDRHVFLGSPMGIMEDGLEYSAQAKCWLAKWSPKGPGNSGMELLQEGQYVDYGLDLYAPQTNLDREGRRVMIAWMRMPRAVMPEEQPENEGEESAGEIPWNGMMCLPRVVEADDNHIFFRVHPETEKHFAPAAVPEGEGKRFSTKHFQKGIFRIKALLPEGGRINIGGYQIWREEGAVKTDRSQVFKGIRGYRTCFSTPSVEGGCRLDIFVEPNLIEIFVNEGEYVLSSVVYGMEPFVEGDIDSWYQFF